MDNKVLLIGTNHHNILGLVRSFGVNGIYPYGLIVGDGAVKSFVRKSKYWAKTWAIDSEDEMIDFMLKQFENEKSRPVVIPCSDLLAEIIDLNYNRLKDKYILPSINNEQGKIAELMDKQRQVELAKEYDIPMAKSWVIDLKNETVPDDIVYPCIVKPVVSAEGKKSDIRKIYNLTDLNDTLIFLKKNSYKTVMIQEYLDYDEEYLMVGSIHNTDITWFYSKKIRVWPVIGGSSSFLEISNDKMVYTFYKRIIKMFKNIGYDGVFDVEAFLIKDKMYLNEINWRNSGTSYSILSSEVYYPLIWYYWVIDSRQADKMKKICNDESIYSMDEALDLRHVICRNISFKQWNEGRKNAKAFSVWNIHDLKPTIIQYMHLIKELIVRKGV